MQVITRGDLRLLLADEGNHIRSIDDVHVPEHKDEQGNVISEHFPDYSEILFLGKQVDITKVNDLYIEESK